MQDLLDHLLYCVLCIVEKVLTFDTANQNETMDCKILCLQILVEWISRYWLNFFLHSWTPLAPFAVTTDFLW
jgi:hypothetical protein